VHVDHPFGRLRRIARSRVRDLLGKDLGQRICGGTDDGQAPSRRFVREFERGQNEVRRTRSFGARSTRDALRVHDPLTGALHRAPIAVTQPSSVPSTEMNDTISPG
jgi:hypothetical protein